MSKIFSLFMIVVGSVLWVSAAATPGFQVYSPIGGAFLGYFVMKLFEGYIVKHGEFRTRHFVTVFALFTAYFWTLWFVGTQIGGGS